MMLVPTMQEYSFLADMLSKFHTSSELIKVLLLTMIPALLFGLFWCIKEVLVATIRRRKNDVYRS
jgi:hypothetical protein